MRRRPLVAQVVSAVSVVAAALFILWQLHPRLLVTDTLAAGGDMGAHVWGPAFLRDEVLGRFRVTGWTPDWYAGFPAYHFYFPLPSLLIVLLDVVLPYTVAFKLVTVVGLVGLPGAAWAFGRLVGLPFPTPSLFALATVPFVFDRYHTIWGGNAAATLAGEFSFTISLCLALLYLGVLADGLRTGRHRALAGVLLAVAGLCHLIPAAFAAAGTIVVLAAFRPAWRRVLYVATAGTVAAGIAAFWLLPFLVRLPYSNDMGWERTDAYVENLLPFLRDDLGGATTAHLRVVVPLAAVGAAAAVIRRRRSALIVTGLAVLSGAAFVLIPEGPIWNARFLPFWYLSLYLLSAVAVAEMAIALAEFFAPEGGEEHVAPTLLAPVLAGALLYVVVGLPLGALPSWAPVSTSDASFVSGWARWNYSGYERKDAYPEYAALVETMADIGREQGCGRAMWEYESELNRFGTPMALMLLPYWTDGCIGSMEGLFFESSATVPYHFLNQSELSKAPSRAMRDLPYRDLDVASGVAHLQLLGVRYYMAISQEAKAQARVHTDLRLLETTAPFDVTYNGAVEQRSWDIYLVEEAELVAPLDYEPVVMRSGARGKEGWLQAAVAWYQAADRWEVPLAADGPAEWARVDGADADPPLDPVRPARVTNISEDASGLQFDVDRPGSPVLVKVSYFPNWKASGADGPWRVTPNLMVVIPTDTHVELRYGWTLVDVVAWLVTIGALAVVVKLARARPFTYPEPPRPPEDWIDPFAVRARPESEHAGVAAGASGEPEAGPPQPSG
jgi:hypothetical protein